MLLKGDIILCKEKLEKKWCGK